MTVNIDPAKARFIRRLLRDRDGVRRELLAALRDHWRGQAEAARQALDKLEEERALKPDLMNDRAWRAKREQAVLWLKWASRRAQS